jgi:prophage antirepressor-like protein
MGTLPAVLNFEGTDLTVVDHAGQPCLTAADVARALGYARSDAVGRIYDRNKGEFTPDMTVTVNLTVPGNPMPIPVRVFSPRGAHLVAMLSRTERARSFRRWVLDVLDGLGRPPALPAPADTEDQRRLRRAINQRAHAMTLRQYETIRQQIVDGLAAFGKGKSVEEQIAMVDTLDIPGGSLVVLHESELWPVTAYASVAHRATSETMRSIHKLEEATGRKWYDHTER